MVLAQDPGMSRRAVLLGVGGLCVGGLVVGCSSSRDTPTGEEVAPSPIPSGQTLAAVADVPVGQAIAVTLAGAPVLLAQPSAGKFVAYSAICSHQGCTVQPESEELVCPCHGARYAVDTGAVTGGPAPQGLTQIPVVVNGSVVQTSSG